MKLVRFGDPGKERPGVWLDAQRGLLDVRALAFDIHDYDGSFFERGGVARLAGLLQETSLPTIPMESQRIGPPLATPGQIICVGRNYADHAREFGGPVPEVPELFGKSPTSWSGPYDPILLPEEQGIYDFEVELAVVMGRRAARLTETNALEHVAGYMLLNDVTDRRAQRAVSQWYYAKSADTFCPVGPWLVTPDELGDPGNVRLQATLNDEVFQQAATRDMIFSIPRLLSYITARVTLQPGDVLATGTPAGVGSARQPPRPLQPGDTVTLEVDHCGRQQCPVLASWAP